MVHWGRPGQRPRTRPSRPRPRSRRPLRWPRSRRPAVATAAGLCGAAASRADTTAARQRDVAAVAVPALLPFRVRPCRSTRESVRRSPRRERRQLPEAEPRFGASLPWQQFWDQPASAGSRALPQKASQKLESTRLTRRGRSSSPLPIARPLSEAAARPPTGRPAERRTRASAGLNRNRANARARSWLKCRIALLVTYEGDVDGRLDITIEILKDIRDATRATNVRLDGVTERLDGVTGRLDVVPSGWTSSPRASMSPPSGWTWWRRRFSISRSRIASSSVTARDVRAQRGRRAARQRAREPRRQARVEVAVSGRDARRGRRDTI